MPNRSHFIDFIKGIAIILVIIPHCIQFGSGELYLNESMFYDNPLFKFIYSFHMPVFMLISGYLFKYSINKHSFSTILKNKITNILVPIIIWHSLFILIRFVIIEGTLNEFSFCSYLKSLWFLWAVFWNSLIILFIHKYAKDSILIYAAFFCISLFIPHKYNSNYFIFMFPYFLCGYFINGLPNPLKGNTHTAKVALCFLIIIFLVMLFSFKRNYYVYETKTYIIKDGGLSFEMLYINAFRWIIGFIGSFIFLKAAHYYYKSHHNSFTSNQLITIGKRTMGIYIISDYTFRFFYLLPIDTLNYSLITLEIVLVLGLSYYTTRMIERNQHTRKILLGGR